MTPQVTVTGPKTPTNNSDDARFMAMAVRMAERGLGTTAPNPSVGAVIVCPETRRILGRGWTQPGGRPHAEPMALQRAGAASRGATLYVTLEPCSHYGRSPPCVDAIIAAGIKRVVAGIKDPDPRVAGRGLARLQDAGISVELGVLRAACYWVTLGHILRVTERRPFTQLKLALNGDGNVPRGHAGAPTWVTGTAARQRGHLLRATVDAIVIGQGTLIDDNPSLTCRLPGLEGHSPARFILGGSRRLDDDFTILRDGRAPVSWVTHQTASVPPQVQASGCDVIRVTEVGGQLWLPAVMEAFVARGITRLLVEGGPTIWQAFDRACLVDEIVMFRARNDLEQRDADEARKLYMPRTPVSLVRRTVAENDDIFIFRRLGRVVN